MPAAQTGRRPVVGRSPTFKMSLYLKKKYKKKIGVELGRDVPSLKKQKRLKME